MSTPSYPELSSSNVYKEMFSKELISAKLLCNSLVGPSNNILYKTELKMSAFLPSYIQSPLKEIFFNSEIGLLRCPKKQAVRILKNLCY